MANVGSIATAKGEQFTHAHVASLSRRNSGFYVLSGCDVHQAGTPGLSVVVDSGYISSGFATARKTVSGGTLIATMKGDKIMLTDENGGMATITIANVYQSNGVIHVTDAVSLPK